MYNSNQKISAYFLVLAFCFAGLTACDDDDHDHDHDGDEHFEAVGLVLSVDDVEVVRLQDGEVTGNLTVLLNGPDVECSVAFILEDGDITKPDDDELDLEISLTDDAFAEVIEIDSDDYTFSIRALQTGITKFRVSLMHEGHADYVSIELPLSIAVI